MREVKEGARGTSAIARIDRSFTSLSAAAPSALAPGHDPRIFSGCTLPTYLVKGTCGLLICS